MCPWAGWRDCEGWEMATGSGVAEALSVVYTVSVRSPFVSERKDPLVAAITPTPCRNGSWGGGVKCVVTFLMKNTPITKQE